MKAVERGYLWVDFIVIVEIDSRTKHGIHLLIQGGLH